jgi:hypothetical protein
MSEVMYRCVCLECSEVYTADIIEQTASCRHCDSAEVEWEGFEV